jgi:hypothetical protein
VGIIGGDMTEEIKKIKEKKHKFRVENPGYDKENQKVRSRRWYENNPQKVRELSKKWKLENPDKVKKDSDIRNKYRVEQILPCYVANTLRMPIANIPPELIEMKRNQILFKRALKELKETLKG